MVYEGYTTLLPNLFGRRERRALIRTCKRKSIFNRLTGYYDGRNYGGIGRSFGGFLGRLFRRGFGDRFALCNYCGVVAVVARHLYNIVIIFKIPVCGNSISDLKGVDAVTKVDRVNKQLGLTVGNVYVLIITAACRADRRYLSSDVELFGGIALSRKSFISIISLGSGKRRSKSSGSGSGCGRAALALGLGGLFGSSRTSGATTGTAAHCLARRSNHIIGHFSSVDQPSILGVINKHVSVTLNVLYDLISTHLPGINGIKLTPFKENIDTLENLFYVVSSPIGAPSYVNVKTDTRHVTLDVIKRLKITAGRVSAKTSLSRSPSIHRRLACNIAILVIASRTIYNSI